MAVPAWLSPVAQATCNSGWADASRSTSDPAKPDPPMTPISITPSTLHVHAHGCISLRLTTRTGRDLGHLLAPNPPSSGVGSGAEGGAVGLRHGVDELDAG